MNFRGYESKVDWLSNQMDVNLCAILAYKKINYKQLDIVFLCYVEISSSIWKMYVFLFVLNLYII